MDGFKKMGLFGLNSPFLTLGASHLANLSQAGFGALWVSKGVSFPKTDFPEGQFFNFPLIILH